MKARTICIKKRNTKRETHRKKNKKIVKLQQQQKCIQEKEKPMLQ